MGDTVFVGFSQQELFESPSSQNLFVYVRGAIFLGSGSSSGARAFRLLGLVLDPPLWQPLVSDSPYRTPPRNTLGISVRALGRSLISRRSKHDHNQICKNASPECLHVSTSVICEIQLLSSCQVLPVKGKGAMCLIRSNTISAQGAATASAYCPAALINAVIRALLRM
jgi:hypothetical protein